jgi:hypothetical protein
VKLSQNDIRGYQNEISGQQKRRRGGYPGTGNVKDGVGVAVAVEVAVAVDVGVGVAVTVGVGVGVGGFGACVGNTGAEDVADGDGFALVGEAEDGATAGALMTAGALVAGERLGDTPPADPVLAVTEALAVPDGLPDRPAAAGGGVCEPVSASTVTIPVAAIAIRTPIAAATPDSASIRDLDGLAGSGKPLGRNGPALCITSRR